MCRALETLDTRVFRIGKQYDQILQETNIPLVSGDFTAYLKGLAKRINLYIEDKIKIGLAQSFKMLQEKLNEYLDDERLPGLTADDVFLNQEIILRNITKSKKMLLDGILNILPKV